ncbi:MAG: SRPBCC domain-containing protein [Nannocystaceae bacterium]
MSSTDNPMFDRPIVELTISAPADEVWRALRDPEQIQQWFGWDTDSLGDEIEYIFKDHASADDATHTITFGGRSDRVTLEARGTDCIVRMVRPAPATITDWDDVFDDEVQGWIAFFNQLAFAFARHRRASRRTLYFSGAPKAGALAAAALGLPLQLRTPGAAVRVAAPTGDELVGTLWHRGRHQIGVTVDAWGDGLLVIIDRSPDAKRPAGSTQVILTTYGLSDAAFAALEDRWKRWWPSAFAPWQHDGT